MRCGRSDGVGAAEGARDAGHHELAEYLVSKGALGGMDWGKDETRPVSTGGTDETCPVSTGGRGAAAAGRARLSDLGKHSVAGLDRRLGELEA